MNLASLIEQSKQFPPYCDDSKKEGIYEKTKDYLDRFIDLINDLDDREVVGLHICKRHLLNKIRHDKQIILKAIELHANSVQACHDLIFNHFINPESGEKNLFLKPMPKMKPIFRMRSVEKLDERLTAREMFHIPFECVARTANQRFSMKGFPFLYAGTSIDVCWEEIGRPSLRFFNVSALRTERVLHMFDMLFPTKIERKEDLLTFPLRIACGIQNSSNDSQKLEYIIPQAVLSGVIRFNSDNSKYDLINAPRGSIIPHIDGIIYLSSRVAGKNLREIDENDYCNYVFPVKFPQDNGLCPELCDLFSISEPVNVKFLCEVTNELFGSDIDVSELTKEIADPEFYFSKLEECIRSRHSAKYNLKPIE